MLKRLRDYKIVGLVFVVFSILYSKVVLHLAPAFPVITDSLKYLKIAESIRSGSYLAIKGILYPPGYPTYIAFLQEIVGTSVEYIYLSNFLLLGGIAFFIYLIALHHIKLSPLLSFLAGLSVFFWPYFILYSLLVMSEVPFVFFFTASIFLLFQSLKSGSKKIMFVTGICFAIATLIRPVILLLPFWLIGILLALWLLKKVTVPSKKQITVGFVAFFLTLAPWSLYLYSETGSILPVSSHLPYVLDKSYNTLSYEEAYQGNSLKPEQTDVILSKVRNFFLFWNPGAGGTQAEYLIEKVPEMSIVINIYKIGFFLILFLAFLSIRRLDKSFIILLFAIILYFWAIHTVLYPYPRYTLPTIPFVLLLAFVTIEEILIKKKILWMKKF